MADGTSDKPDWTAHALSLPHPFITPYSIAGLPDVVSRCLRRPRSSIQFIRFIGSGSTHHVFEVTLSGEFKCAMRIAANPSLHDSDCMQSGIATVDFIGAQIPLMPILAFDTTASNEIGAPFMITGYAEGRTILNSKKFIRDLEEQEQSEALRAVAKIHAKLLKMAPSQRIHQIFRAHPEASFIERSMIISSPPYGDLSPGRIVDVWLLKMAIEVDRVSNNSLRKKEGTKFTQVRFDRRREVSTGQYWRILAQIRELISEFSRSCKELDYFCIIHPDWALRNFIFNRTSWSDVVAVIDWDGVWVGPVLATAVYPEEISPPLWDAVRGLKDDKTFAKSSTPSAELLIKERHRRQYSSWMSEDLGRDFQSLAEKGVVYHRISDLVSDSSRWNDRVAQIEEMISRLRDATSVTDMPTAEDSQLRMAMNFFAEKAWIEEEIETQ